MGFLLRYIRACAVCRKFYPPMDWLCRSCWRRLESELLPVEDVYRTEKTLPHLRLFDWHGENGRFMRRLLESLKGGAPEFVFDRLGLECFSRFIHRGLWPKGAAAVFVPAPPRSHPLKDHARALAEALARRFGGRVSPALRKKDGGQAPQKRKSRQARGQIEFLSAADFNKAEITVFVDDALTTGATARAAFRALGRPEKFFVFTLAWRRPPAPPAAGWRAF